MGGCSNGGKQSWKELVGKDKNQEGGVLAGLGEVRHGPHIGGKGNPRQVLDVFVAFVDDFRELAGFFVVVDGDHFLVDPHVDLGFIKGQALAVSTHDCRNRRAPVSAANDADAVQLTVRVLGIDREGIVHWIGHGSSSSSIVFLE